MSRQPSFHAGNIERQHSGGVQIELLAFVGESVPDFHGVVPRHPDLVAEIAGVAGAGNVDRHSCDFAAGDAEVFQVGDVGVGNGFQQLG